jgi:hypothetical protein
MVRSLHAGLLATQGLPIIIGVILAIWLAYYIRAAVMELRAIRANLDWLNDRVEERVPDSIKPKPATVAETVIVAEPRSGN